MYVRRKLTFVSFFMFFSHLPPMVTMINIANMLVTMFFKGGEQSSPVRDVRGPGKRWILQDVGLH